MRAPAYLRFRQTGSGLLEVLVLIVVMAVGMLAMAKMHTMLIRDGGTANNRAIATSLAQEKIDDLRGFKWIDPDQADLNGEDCTDADTYCYSEIADNAGGLVPAGSVAIGNTSFNLSWTSEENVNWRFKSVTVTVTWRDQNGDGQVQLQSAIFSTDNTASALEGAFGASGGPGPKVQYTPIGVPDAVPVEIGSVDYKESSKPVPDVSQHGHSTVVGFDTTAYNTPGNYIDSQEEFITASCVCEFAGTGAGMTPTRMVWNPVKKMLEPELGVMETKTIGRVPTTGTFADQSDKCNICCRDHHDMAGTSYPKYDPLRPSGDFTSGDHNHYLDQNGNGVLTAGEAVTSGQYYEACRLKRINGLFYAMQDWHMRDLIVMPKDHYLGVTATLSAYEAYLQTAIAYFGLGVDSLGAAFPAPDKNDLVSRDDIQLTAGQQSQLLARGLYVDTIYQCRPGAKGAFSDRTCPSGNDPTAVDTAYLTDIRAIKAANEDPDNPDMTTDWRKHIPFYEINLTILAGWGSDEPGWVSVDNDPVQDVVNEVTGYYTTYYRGRVTGSATSPASNEEATITATARTGNTGITSGVMSATGNPDGYGLDPDDDTSVLSDSLHVTRLAAVTTYGISGNLALTYTANANKPKPNTWGATALPSSGVTCNSTGNAANNPGYSCTVPTGWTGVITPFATGGGSGNDPAGTTYYFSPISRAYVLVTSAQTNQNFLFCKLQSLCQ